MDKKIILAEWCKENLNTYQNIEKEFEEPDDDKKYYSDFDEYLSDSDRWWIETFGQLNDQEKENFIQRYRSTIACCLHSNTYNEETIKEKIEDSW